MDTAAALSGQKRPAAAPTVSVKNRRHQSQMTFYRITPDTPPEMCPFLRARRRPEARLKTADSRQQTFYGESQTVSKSELRRQTVRSAPEIHRQPSHMHRTADRPGSANMPRPTNERTDGAV